MANKGIAPLEPLTPVGQLRANLGDTQYEALNPVELGFGDYDRFSDVELATFLVLAGDNITRATGNAVMQLAIGAGLEGKSIKTDDLGIDIKSRGDTLEKIARSLWKQADEADARTDVSFEIVQFGTDVICEDFSDSYLP